MLSASVAAAARARGPAGGAGRGRGAYPGPAAAAEVCDEDHIDGEVRERREREPLHAVAQACSGVGHTGGAEEGSGGRAVRRPGPWRGHLERRRQEERGAPAAKARAVRPREDPRRVREHEPLVLHQDVAHLDAPGGERVVLHLGPPAAEEPHEAALPDVGGAHEGHRGGLELRHGQRPQRLCDLRPRGGRGQVWRGVRPVWREEVSHAQSAVGRRCGRNDEAGRAGGLRPRPRASLRSSTALAPRWKRASISSNPLLRRCSASIAVVALFAKLTVGNRSARGVGGSGASAACLGGGRARRSAAGAARGARRGRGRARCEALAALERRLPQDVDAQERLLVVRRADGEVEQGALERVQPVGFGEAPGVGTQGDGQDLRVAGRGAGGEGESRGSPPYAARTREGAVRRGTRRGAAARVRAEKAAGAVYPRGGAPG